MKTPAAHTTDGLEWLRAIRRDLQREIGQTPQERAAYSGQGKETARAHAANDAPRATSGGLIVNRYNDDTKWRSTMCANILLTAPSVWLLLTEP